MTTRQRVENLLKYVPDTRSDDRLLCVLFMQKSGLNLSEEQIKKFYEMDDLWNVRRIRQRIQEQGLYPPTPEVERARYKKFVKVKHSINHEPIEETFMDSNGIQYKLPNHW